MTKAEAFERLGKSKFRSRFRLTAADRAYIERVGLETVRRHAEDFVRMKLAPAEPEKDGRPLSAVQQRKAVDFLMERILAHVRA